MEFHIGAVWANLQIVRIPPEVATQYKTQRILATLHNSGWMDHYQVCDGPSKALPILVPVDDKKLSVALHHIITVYNDMFNHLDGIMCALGNKKTPWNEVLFFAMNFGWQMLCKYYAEVTPMTGKHLFSAHILDSSQKLLAFT